jgi:glycosyltransferase involved in cell wall biosynthesis
LEFLTLNDANAGLPLLSIVIPTRERGEFLASAVRSALACPDPGIEVVVSDNDSADGTGSIVSAIQDKRLVYVNTGTRVPMHDNFEFALQKSRGRYLTYIGDDDAVLPGRLAHLLALLREEEPEVVNWQAPNYVWPGGANGADGLLTLKPQHRRGGQTRVASRELLQGMAGGSKSSFRIGGAKIYHGCVARRVVDRVIARTGRYFLVPWPDVGAAIANLFVTDSILMLGTPCTLGGESRASNGWAQRFQDSAKDIADNPHTAFVREYLDRPDAAAADARIRPIAALTFFTLAATAAKMGEASKPPLDHRAWLALIEPELASLSEPARSQQSDIIDASLQAAGLPRLDRAWPSKEQYKPPRVRPPVRHHRLLPNRMSIVSRPGLCSNVFEAALAVDRVLADTDDSRPRAGLTLSASWLAALARAASLIRNPASVTVAGVATA